MEIEGKNVLVLGAYGEAGIAICRQILRYLPAELVVTSLAEEEAQWALKDLEPETPSYCKVRASWGNIFVRWPLKDMRLADIASSPEHLRTMVDDNLNELTEDILTASTLYKLVTEFRPEIIVDCINTATALSYQNIYHAYHTMEGAGEGSRDAAPDLPYHLLSAVSIPPLIRHVQILHESMKRSGTRLYLKIGTTGTGGMGFNIPFTHGEENPSRLLMTKAATAGAHTMLLYTLSRTPGWPIIKEIKPAAMIGWKDIGKGVIRRGNRGYPLYDCPVEGAFRLMEGSTFSYEEMDMRSPGGRQIEGVYIDTGENGVFSVDEFKAITSLGLMEFVTPEDIAHHTIMNIIGISSSKDVIAAIDNSVMEPTFRAGILRRDAIEEAARLGGGGVAYGFLGPKMSKLITECQLIKQSYGTVEDALSVSPERLAYSLEKLLEIEPDIRNATLSIGVPVLLPDGQRLLFARRAVRDKGWETSPWTVTAGNIDKWAEREWVDLRPSNMARWQERFRKASEDACRYPDKHCSRFNRGMLFWKKTDEGKTIIDGGEITAWVFINEFGGGRPHAYGESKEMVYF